MKLTYDKLVSSFAFNFNMRRFTKAASAELGAEGVDFAKEQGLLEPSPLKVSPAKAILAGGVLRTTTRPDPLLFQKLGVSVCESRIPRLAGRADRPFQGVS